jgi:hypothetical protein
MLQARQSLASASNCSITPYYTDCSVAASHDNTVIILNKNEYNKNVSYTLTMLPM